jgi:hypothetical protein
LKPAGRPLLPPSPSRKSKGTANEIRHQGSRSRRCVR